MPDDHRDTWGAPSSGWIEFDENGQRVWPCCFCDHVAKSRDALADHHREERGQ